MANYTTNLNLEKPVFNETADIEVINRNMDKIDSEMIFKTASGTGTEITISAPEVLSNGYHTTFIASANNGGASTTVNGKNLYKPNTTTPPNITNGKAYSIWYNSASDCFFLQASAEGNAPQSSVLAGATFSNDNDTGLVGTMPNNGAISGTLNAGGSKVIPAGYTSGGTITANSLASQTSATAVAGHILSGATAWVNGNKITGTIPTAGPTYADQRHASAISIGNYSGDGQINTYFQVPNGHYLSGVNWIKYPTPYLQPQFIVSGANILGVNGTATVQSMGGRRFASGTISAMKNNSVSVILQPISVPFTPSVFTFSGTFNAQYSGTPSGLKTLPFTGTYNPASTYLHMYIPTVTTAGGTGFYPSNGMAMTVNVSKYNLYVDQPPNTVTWYAWE